MKRLVLLVSLLGVLGFGPGLLRTSSAFAHPRGAQRARRLTGEIVPLLGRTLRARRGGIAQSDAFSRQSVQTGIVRTPGQLELPASAYPSTFTLKDTRSVTAYDADQTELGTLHTITYENLGMLGGWYEWAQYDTPDVGSFVLTYLASYYASPDAATNAFNDASGQWAFGEATSCTFPGADQCAQVVLQDKVQNENGFPYSAVFLMLLKSNSIFEGGYLLEQDAWNIQADRDQQMQNLNALAGAYLTRIEAGPPTPTPLPTQPSVPHPTATATPVPPPPTATATPAPSPTPTEIRYSIVAARIERAGGQEGPNAPALTAARAGTTVSLAVYFQVTSGPPGAPYTVSGRLSRGNAAVMQWTANGRLDQSQPAGTYTVRKAYRLSAAGRYLFKGSVSLGGRVETLSSSIAVRAAAKQASASHPHGPFWFSFDRLQIVGGQNRPQLRFHRGDTLIATGVYTIHNASGTVAVHIMQSYRYWDASTRAWLSGPFPLRVEASASDGPQTFAESYSIPSALNQTLQKIRVIDTITIGSETRHRSAVIAVS